jgi:hypothetical protein
MFCPSRLFRAAEQRAIELPHLETFAGAACSQPIGLPSSKAAPPPGVWSASTRGVFALLYSFLILQALVRNFLNWTTQGRRLSALGYDLSPAAAGKSLYQVDVSHQPKLAMLTENG